MNNTGSVLRFPDAARKNRRFFNVIIPLIHQNKRCYIGNQIQLAVIFPPPKAGEQYERTAILYHQQYTSKLGVQNKTACADSADTDAADTVPSLILFGHRGLLSTENMGLPCR